MQNRLSVEYLSTIERIHFRFQLGMFLSHIEETPWALLLGSDFVDDYYWNYAAAIKCPPESTDRFMGFVEGYYKAKQRGPAFYTTPWTRPESLTSVLRKRGYQPVFSDAWMISDVKEAAPRRSPDSGVEIRAVESDSDRKTFVETFMTAFGYVDESVPYGGLPDTYRMALEYSLSQERTDIDARHYLAFSGGSAIGTGTLLCADGFGGLYNLGVIPASRQRGVGKMLAEQRIFEAVNEFKCHTLFFQTEADGVVEKLYAKAGFQRGFVGTGWAPSE